MAERYPLSWPAGWTRTNAGDRQRASFQTHKTTLERRQDGSVAKRSSTNDVSVSDALKRLLGELRRLGVEDGDCIISTNMPTRLDGLPYSTAKEPTDPGAAVYFRLKGQDRVLACDAWSRVAGNLAAIAQHIDAVRRIDRYGVGTLEQAFAGYAALPARGDTWRSAFGFSPDDPVTADAVEAAFRTRARESHPDVGGSHEAMAALTNARAEAVLFLEGR
ncbi:MAG: J domain-containing protein [Acidobacteria bacterium]|nr:J domain-containing protein [Acidobacteriota bacterium]